MSELEKKEKPKLASHEKLVPYPKCGNDTLLISEKAEFNTCVNLNCGYFERKKNYIDAVGYNWEKE